ncbi:MAG: response regulator transcription factor [Pseudomonadota bacterium]
MDQAPQLLLMDGDAVLCQVLVDYLQGQGFGVTVAPDGEAGLLQASQGVYDLVIVDDRLPRMGGIEVLRRIRRQGELPVVILSAGNDDIERIVGLELGADDYLSKSCNLRELVARLNSILRRTRLALAAERMRGSGIESLSLVASQRTATWRGEPLPLTSTEFDVLEALFRHPGRAVRKAELAKTVLGREIQHYERSLDMHISNLRKKLGKLADGRSPILTVRGTGYQLLRK